MFVICESSLVACLIFLAESLHSCDAMRCEKLTCRPSTHRVIRIQDSPLSTNANTYFVQCLDIGRQLCRHHFSLYFPMGRSLHSVICRVRHPSVYHY